MDVDGDEYLREMEENLGIDRNRTNGKEETASQEQRKTVLERARSELNKLADKIMGKMLLRNRVTGEVRVMEKDYKGIEAQEEEIRCEELAEIDEEEIDLEVEVIEKEKEMGGGSIGSSQNLDKFSYLEDLEEIDRESEKGRGEESKKRKEGEEKVELKLRGLKAMPGWIERSKKAMEDLRWQLSVTDKTDNGEERKERKVGMKIVEGQDIGLDKRGPVLNSSNRRNHNFGPNRQAIFARKDGQKGEDRNWTATFTRQGCVVCRKEDGGLNHKGRNGEPGIVIIGDGSVPAVTGYTVQGKEDGCAWVFRKELLGLEEVPNILRKINEEKREWDRKGNRREHEFFVTEGSKVIVCSYAHLRKEGLEGYIHDFNSMIWNCGKEVGEKGIEILPCAPTITDDMDDVGKQLVVGLIDWIEWVAERTDRKEIVELGKTGGSDRNKSRKGLIGYRPSFVRMEEKVRKVGTKELKRYSLEMVKGERREIIDYMPNAPEEIRGILEKRGKNMREDEEERLTRICTENGISV